MKKKYKVLFKVFIISMISFQVTPLDQLGKDNNELGKVILNPFRDNTLYLTPPPPNSPPRSPIRIVINPQDFPIFATGYQQKEQRHNTKRQKD